MFQRSFLYIMLSLMTAFSLAQCSDDSSSGSDSSNDDVYLATNVPSKFKVDTPKTVNSSSTLDVKSGRMDDFPDGGDFPDEGGDFEEPAIPGEKCFDFSGGFDDSFGYQQIKSAVCEMQTKARQLQFEVMMVDSGYDDMLAVIEANGDDTFAEGGASVDAGSFEITFTRPMRNLMVKEFGSFFSEDELDQFIPSVGDKLENPALTYAQGENGEYDHTLTYDDFEVEAAGGDFGGGIEADLSTTILWDNEKTKIRIDQSGSFSFSFGGEDESDIFTSSFSYDATEALMIFKDSSESNFAGFSSSQSFSTTMKECGADNCIEIQMTNEADFGAGDTISDNSFGVADDNGGFVESEFNFGIGDSVKYRETFDGDGNLLNVCFDDGLGSGFANEGDFTGGCDFGDNEYFGDVFDEGGESILDFGFIEVTVTGLGDFDGEGGYSTFYIVLPGSDPNDNPWDIIGDGFNDPEFGFVVNYYGDESIPLEDLTVWYETGFNETTFEPEYAEISGAAVE